MTTPATTPVATPGHPACCTSCSGPTRRALLAGAGAVGAAGLLAACGGGGSTGPAAASAPDDTADTAVAELATLRERGAVGFETDDGRAIAIDLDGEVVAYSAVCTHNGCTVGWDAGRQQIRCPCHGSLFDPSDGSVLEGPARKPLPAVDVAVDEAAGVLRLA